MNSQGSGIMIRILAERFGAQDSVLFVWFCCFGCLGFGNRDSDTRMSEC